MVSRLKLRPLAWSFGAALIPIAVFHLRYAVLDAHAYSLSWVPGQMDLILYIAITTAIGWLPGWLVAMFGQTAFRQGQNKDSAAVTSMGYSLAVLTLLALPVAVSYALNSFTTGWTLPEFLSYFIALLSLIQALVAAVLGLLFTGLTILVTPPVISPDREHPMPSGYYRNPTIQADTVIFVCEDDLWTVSAAGGIARRLTSNLGEITSPFLSPDGSQVAFVGRDEGQPEVYVMPARGGQPRRLTFQGAGQVLVAGWTADGQIVYASPVGQPFRALLHLYSISPDGGEPTRLDFGPARAIAFGPNGAVVIGRNTGDPARWKRYHGGTAGQLWIDPDGNGEFHPLISLEGQPGFARCGWANASISSQTTKASAICIPACRMAATCAATPTRTAFTRATPPRTGGASFITPALTCSFTIQQASTAQKIEVEFYSPQVQRNRKFVDAERYLSQWSLHPHGVALAVQSRSYLLLLLQLGRPGHPPRRARNAGPLPAADLAE